MKIAYKVSVMGRVTGVGFRFSTYDKAQEFPSVQGYVRNLARGHVEVFMQGEKEELDQMLEWLRQGPPFAFVERCDYIPAEISSEYKDFQIR